MLELLETKQEKIQSKRKYVTKYRNLLKLHQSGKKEKNRKEAEKKMRKRNRKREYKIEKKRNSKKGGTHSWWQRVIPYSEIYMNRISNILNQYIEQPVLIGSNRGRIIVETWDSAQLVLTV